MEPDFTNLLRDSLQTAENQTPNFHDIFTTSNHQKAFGNVSHTKKTDLITQGRGHAAPYLHVQFRMCMHLLACVGVCLCVHLFAFGKGS